MKGIAIVIISVVIVLFIRKFFNRKRKVVITSKEDQRKENQQQEKRKNATEQVKISVYTNQWKQINVECFSLQGKKMGELLASYKLNSQTGNSYTVHLEQLLVERKFRRKGVGSLLFAYLLKEMQNVEVREGCEFRFIYGEVGTGGSDDPHMSIPYYRKQNGLPYGKRKKLQYELVKKSSSEEYDKIYYYLKLRT